MLMHVPDKLKSQYLGMGRHWRRVTMMVEMNCATSKTIVAILAFQNHVRRSFAMREMVSNCDTGMIEMTYRCVDRDT
jgi:hypothetical protein